MPALTKALNTYLGLDSESKQRLKKLQGNIITIELLPFHFIFQCAFHEEGVVIHLDELLPAETRIRGTPLQLVGVMMTKGSRNHFFAEDVVMEGNAELGQQVIALFDELHIDKEEYFSRVIGDAPAHHINRLLHSVGEWLSETNQRFSQDVSEFIHEEAHWLPTREALQDFFHDIDTLRMDVDRLDAEVKQVCDLHLNNKE